MEPALTLIDAREKIFSVRNWSQETSPRTHKVQRGGEPVGVGDGGHRQIDECSRDRRLACGQTGLPIQSRRRAFVGGQTPFQLLGVRFLEIDRINGAHQRLGPSLRQLARQCIADDKRRHLCEGTLQAV